MISLDTYNHFYTIPHMNEDNKKLGEKLKAYRLQREMTQEQAAALFRISRTTYYAVESGKGCGDLTRAKILKVIVPIALEAKTA